MNVLMNKPIFELVINTFGVSYLIRVNGVSVLKEYNPLSQIDTTIPINHWMKPGKNALSLIVLPEGEGEVINPQSRILIEVWVSSVEQNDLRYKVTSVKFNGNTTDVGLAVVGSGPSGRFDSASQFNESGNGDVAIGEISLAEIKGFSGAYTFEREMDIPSSLPLWKFFRGEDLPDYDNMPDEEYFRAVDDLFAPYKVVQDALASGDVDSIMAIFEERNMETDMAFHLKPGTTRDKLKSSMLEAIRNDNLELAALSPDILNIRVESNKKLVSLIRDEEMSAVGFNYKSFSGSQSYPLMLRRENGKWIVTR